MKDPRTLADLGSVGPAVLRDFERLGVGTVAQLARRNPERLYEELCEVTGQTHDICCLDVFRCAVAQARNPRLPVEQTQWWYWSRRRKGSERVRPARRDCPVEDPERSRGERPRSSGGVEGQRFVRLPRLRSG